MVVLSTAHPAKFPDAVEAACGSAPALPDWLADLDRRGRSASPCCRPIRARSSNSSWRRAVPRAKERPHERRTSHVCRPASPSSPTRCRICESASLGVWVGAGSRDERADEHGISHLLEHMAFKGTRAAHRAPDRRGDRGGRRRPQRGDQRRDHGLLRARAEGRRAARARRPVRHPLQSDLRAARSWRASRTSSCRRSAPSRTRPTISSSSICRATAFPGPADRPLDPRHARDRALVRPRASLRAYLARNYRAPDMVVAAAGAVDHQAVVAEVERRFARFNGPGGAGAGAGALRRRHAHRERAISSRCTSRSRSKACRSAIPRSTACRSSPTCSAAACRRGCSRRCARSAGFATRSMRSMRPMPTPACSASMPAPTPPTCPS